MGIGSLILYLIGLIFAVLLFLVLVAIIAAAAIFIGYFKEEIFDNEEGIFHKITDKLGVFY